MSKKAMKLALEALELEDLACRYEKEPTPKHISKAITALKQALEQPELEPVECHTCKGLGRIYMGCGSWIHCDTCNTTGKATTPPKREWVGLTDKELNAIYEQHHNQYAECISPNFGYEHAIEAKLKEKNT